MKYLTKTTWLCALLLLGLLLSACSDGQVFLDSTDTAHYDPAFYESILPLFPRALPPEAQANYHVYRFDTEARDEFLELTFFDREAYAKFVSSVLAPIPSAQLAQRVNPYDARYTEYFYTGFSAGSRRDGEWVLSNYITWQENGTISAYYHAMNASEAQLKVVICYADGQFVDETPMYVTYFGIPLGTQGNNEMVFEETVSDTET